MRNSVGRIIRPDFDVKNPVNPVPAGFYKQISGKPPSLTWIALWLPNMNPLPLKQKTRQFPQHKKSNIPSKTPAPFFTPHTENRLPVYCPLRNSFSSSRPPRSESQILFKANSPHPIQSPGSQCKLCGKLEKRRHRENLIRVPQRVHYFTRKCAILPRRGR